MDKELIQRLALQAGFDEVDWQDDADDIVAFATLVAEECAKLADFGASTPAGFVSLVSADAHEMARQVAVAIRAAFPKEPS